MLYGYKLTIGIALRTLKLSANICRHNKCRHSLTEPTTQVSVKVCTVLPCSSFRFFQVKRKKTQNILPLSPTARKEEAAATSHGRQASPPPTPSLAAAALLHSAAARRNPNHGCPIACNSASTQDVAHPRSHRLQLWICVYDSLGFGVPAAGTKSSRRCSCAGLHSGFSPLFQVRAPLLLEAALSSIRPLSPDSRIYNIPGSE